MKVEQFTYMRAESIVSVVEALRQHGQKAAILGGGTELVVRMKQQVSSPEVIIDIRHIPELCGITIKDGVVSIGAATTLHAVETSGILQQELPALVQAAHNVASMQIRNLATLGGNLCQENRCIYFNQSKLWKKAKGRCYKSGGETCYVMNRPGVCYATYRGDVAPALLVLDAEVEIMGPRGSRWQPVADLYSGEGRAPLALSTDEFLTQIRAPLTPGRRSIYLKLSHRKVVDFPLVSLALALGPGREAKLAIGALGPQPLRIPEAEALLVEADPVAKTVLARAADVAVKACNPVVDNMVQGSPGYRRGMVGVLLRRAWTSLENGSGSAQAM